jgi:hypothetical protein
MADEAPFGGHAFGEVPFGPEVPTQDAIILAPNTIILHGLYTASNTLAASYQGSVNLHGLYAASSTLAGSYQGSINLHGPYEASETLAAA